MYECEVFYGDEIQDVCKSTALSRLFPSYTFGASLPVSTKESLWDLTFNVNLFFKGFLVFIPDDNPRILMRERRGCESNLTVGEG